MAKRPIERNDGKKETYEDLKVIEIIPEPEVILAAIPETAPEEIVPKETVEKNPVIIAKVPTVFRSSPNLSSEYIKGTMPAGVAFEIIGEHTSKIYGEFYKLQNGMYITKGGLYAIS